MTYVITGAAEEPRRKHDTDHPGVEEAGDHAGEPFSYHIDGTVSIYPSLQRVWIMAIGVSL